MRSRVKQIKKKFKNIPSKMYMLNNKWFIERSIVYLFLPKYKTKKSTLYNQDWKSFITWITKDSFDKDYHYSLIGEVQYHLPEGRFLWVVEQTQKGVNHVHMVSDMKPKEIKNTINTIINRYLPAHEYRLEVAEINNVINVIDYMLKTK
ncbi:hypothetical protein INR75_17155 [Zunongwangia sp. SCSIO 43204]|uniref:hypothetical protein n=1 Tax=Zunongwangia sp. SCSIO 43204 TaxID=2779359 RepID=UPI001CA7FB60|nr:hypothetical protein [Zunongwangia sp. SCSIO 43204]UAB83880.1 hypothetical protein INR75_17155 [Zunongwangia sp. SCSIO 43204]